MITITTVIAEGGQGGEHDAVASSVTLSIQGFTRAERADLLAEAAAEAAAAVARKYVESPLGERVA